MEKKKIPSLIPPIWNVPIILFTLLKFNSYFKVNLNLTLQTKFFLLPQLTVILLFQIPEHKAKLVQENSKWFCNLEMRKNLLRDHIKIKISEAYHEPKTKSKDKVSL